MSTNISSISDSRVLAVVGPTGSGKSALAVRLALAIGGEVISADSMQIYRGLNIGTAKIPLGQRRGVTHHILDVCTPGSTFSAADYQAMARQIAGDIIKRGKWPIFAGGTGLYIDSALYNYEYKKEDKTQRAMPRADESPSKEELWSKLEQVDPDSASRLHPNDTKRILRALDYHAAHGTSISKNTAAANERKPFYQTLWLGLNLQRQTLYRRIDQRVDEMIQAGLMSEAADAFKDGLDPDSQAGQAIGYRQMLSYFNGESSFDEAVASIKQESRRYAKRQLTWFNKNKAIIWLDAERAAGLAFEEDLAKLLPEETLGLTESDERVRDFFNRRGLLYKNKEGQVGRDIDI